MNAILPTHHSRAIRPAPSRKSAFTADVAATVYSQPDTDFQPPSDYVGPGKAKMRRAPDPSMNLKKDSFPILSVSKLHLDIKAPPSSKTSLPTVKKPSATKKSDFAQDSRKFLERNQVKKILQKMPTVFRKQFAKELKKKRPYKGCMAKMVRMDFHENLPQEAAVLHGILLLGGDHRDMVEEAPQDPGTPLPLSGRRHCISQTDIWLEDITDYEVEFKNTEMQCEDIFDEPLEATQLNFETEGLVTTSTQLDHWEFPDLEHIFDHAVENLTEAVIMEALKQLQEEYELQALRKQQEYHSCVRNREIRILAKYKAAQEKHEERKKYLDDHKTWEEDLDKVIEQVGFDKIRDIAPRHFVQGRIDRAIYDRVQETIVPPVNEAVTEQVMRIKESRNLLDSIIEETVLMREAEYAGRMYTRDPFKKGSLATNSPFDSEEEWIGEEYETLLPEDYYPMTSYSREGSYGSHMMPSGLRDEFGGEGADNEQTAEMRGSDSSGESTDEFDNNYVNADEDESPVEEER